MVWVLALLFQTRFCFDDLNGLWVETISYSELRKHSNVLLFLNTVVCNSVVLLLWCV